VRVYTLFLSASLKVLLVSWTLGFLGVTGVLLVAAFLHNGLPVFAAVVPAIAMVGFLLWLLRFPQDDAIQFRAVLI
jgi:hypothetical protein